MFCDGGGVLPDAWDFSLYKIGRSDIAEKRPIGPSDILKMHGLGFRKSNSERRSKSASRRSKRGCMAVAGAVVGLDGELCGPVPDLLGQGREQPTLSSRKPTQDRGAWPGYTHKSIHRTLSKT